MGLIGRLIYTYSNSKDILTPGTCGGGLCAHQCIARLPAEDGERSGN